MTNPVLFLDIDGVLNDHVRHANKVCGIKPECVLQLNRVLDAIPDLQIVLSSAWRYYVHSGFMTLEGLELMFQTHAVNCHKRLHGITAKDETVPIVLGDRTWQEITDEEKELLDHWGPIQRVAQIKAYVAEHEIERFAVVDDIALPIENIVVTHRDKGMTRKDSDLLIGLLTPRRGSLAPKYERNRRTA